MALVYKQFGSARTVFYACIAALFLIFAAPAQAQPNPAYTVEGVEVDVTAENAVKARENAMLEAQVKAYQMLAERFLTPDELKNFKAPDPDTVSGIVQDFEVTNEQLSAVRYKGVFTVRFRPNAMKTQMASQGQVYSDVQKKPVLVLPFYQLDGQTTLWGESNPWMKAWQSLPSDKSMLQPTTLPLGDAQDMTELADQDALKTDPMHIQQMASRYQADDVAILLASLEPLPMAGVVRLVVNIYNNGFDGPVFVQKVTLDQTPGEQQDALFARGAMKVKGLLRQNWKANAAYAATTPVQPAFAPPTTVPTAPPMPYTRTALGPSTAYTAHAVFASVQDWVRMKNTLDRVYGMQAVAVKTLKPREALIDLRYAGNINALQLALQNAGITMRATSVNAPIELYLGQTQPIYR